MEYTINNQKVTLNDNKVMSITKEYKLFGVTFYTKSTDVPFFEIYHARPDELQLHMHPTLFALLSSTSWSKQFFGIKEVK